MDLKTPNLLANPFPSQSNKESYTKENEAIVIKNTGNSFPETFLDRPDPFCKLNLRDTSDFVRSFPISKTFTETERFVDSPSHSRRGDVPLVSQRRLLEAPPTPGRHFPAFNAVGSPISNRSRKPFPSKWDDAEKWLISSSCNGSPAHIVKHETQKLAKQHSDGFASKAEPFAKKLNVSPDNVSSLKYIRKGCLASDKKSNFLDKFTDNADRVNSNLRYCEPMKETFFFRNPALETIKDGGVEVVEEANRRDAGTEMTPFGSTRNSRSPTPVKMPSPPRHNTPATCSGPLGPPTSAIDISEINEHRFGNFKPRNQIGSMDLYVSTWNSKEEEAEEISRSLRHFEAGMGRKSTGECMTSFWDDEEKTECCVRYQREEAKIQAWVNLQNAKAEAQSKKLEVKIQRMRSDLEEKLMKKMAVVHRQAEEWRAAAQLQHSHHTLLIKASRQSPKVKTQSSYFPDNSACSCFR